MTLKNVVVVILIAGAIVSARGPAAHAVGISVGFNAWYNWWNPSWNDAQIEYTIHQTLANNIYENIVDFPDFSRSFNVMYGPSLSVTLNRFTLSSVFMYGNYYNRTKGIVFATVLLNGVPIPSNNPVAHLTRKSKKWVNDSAILYAITDYFRIFLGFKAHGYRYDEIYDSQSGPQTFRNYSDVKVNNFGPGIGLSLNINIFGSFHLLYNISFIHLWGTEEISLQYRFVPNTYLVEPKGYFTSYGFTTSASLAYVFNSIHTTLVLGFRYQLLKYRQRNEDISMNYYDGNFDVFYGVTMAAVYTFTF